MEKNSKNKKWFYLVLLIIPFVFFITLELGLRAFNYGTDYSTFVVIEEIADQYIFNPDLTKKYFTNTNAIPSVIPDPFNKVKDENTIRIFAFGGSTTAGYPFSANASFPREIKRKVEMYYPDYKIEVINLGVSAVNSHFIRNILPDVLAQDPDLLIFYAGHNEYYGALGPASTEYIFSDPSLVQFILDIREFKVYQLMQNIMRSVTTVFSNEDNISRTTLMSEMIEEQEIPLESEIYKSGLIQYEENLRVILQQCNDNGIPVIFGNLVSNLKQKPLLSTDSVAQSYFADAKIELNNGDTLIAKDNFIKAKDADLLRFRASEDFNEIIFELKNEYDFQFLNIKAAFEKSTSDGITGFNLMVDHLHPNLAGYKLMADQFYFVSDKILSKKFRRQDKLTGTAIENYLDENFPFGRYDSTLADITIKILLNNFPFANDNNFSLASIELVNFEDTLAMETINKGLGWAAAYLKLFDYYFAKGDYNKAAKDLFILMEGRPFYKSALTYAIPKLISKGLSREAKHILVRNHKRYPDFFTSKNLGIINVLERNVHLAKGLFLEAESYHGNDAELYFYLSRTYFTLHDISSAISSMERCLQISPEYPGAQKIYDKLLSMKKN